MKNFIIVIAVLCSFGYASMGLCDDSPIDLVKMYVACNIESELRVNSICKLRTAADVQKVICDGEASKMIIESLQYQKNHKRPEAWGDAKLHIDYSKLRFQVVEKGSDYQLVLVTGPVTPTLIDVKGITVEQGTIEMRPDEKNSYVIVIKKRGRWMICDEERRRAKTFRDVQESADAPPAVMAPVEPLAPVGKQKLPPNYDGPVVTPPTVDE